MGGTSKSTQSTQTQSKTQPWSPTIAPLKQVVNNIRSELPNYEPTADENNALDAIKSNALAGNPWTSHITSLTNDLFAGGPDRTGMVGDAYSNYQKQVQPYLEQSYLDPASNPHFNAYTSKLADDAASRVNQMFTGAGRSLSGANIKGVAQGIAEATLPVYANQYNQNVAVQRAAQEGLLGNAQGTAGILSGLDQASLANRSAGIDTANRSLAANNYGSNAVLEAEAQRRGLPLGNLSNVSNLLLPIAGLGQQSSGTSTSQGTQTMSPAQTFATWTSGIGNLFPKAPVKF